MLNALLERQKKSLEEKRALVDSCTKVEEAQNLANEIRSLEDEIKKTEDAIKEEEQRSSNEVKVVHKGKMSNGQENRGEALEDSMEFREAFAEWCKSGKWNFRADESIKVDDVLKVIPNTVYNEFIKELKAYGQLYAKVRKISVKGGVEFPIENLVPTVNWVAEGTSSGRQKAPQLKFSVSFSYYTAEAKIAQSLLSEIVSLPILEKEIGRLLAEAFVKEFDKVIVNGTGSGQPLGILNDTRVPAANKIDMDETEVADWTSFRKKIFANVPLACKRRGIVLMTNGTWESEIMTLRDMANRPLYNETYNPVDGERICRFNGYEVVLVEDDVLKSFSDASDGDAFMIVFDPQSYVINSNLKLGMRRYYDEEKNEWVNKGLTIVDGKLLNTQNCFIISKKISKKV